jgi:hypothetical protein
MRRAFLLLSIVLLTGGGFAWWWISRADDTDLPGDFSWDFTPPLVNAVPVAATTQLEGFYFAGSRIKDDQALGGFGKWENWPKPLGANGWGAKEAISLVAFPEEPIAYFKHRGIALRLINRTQNVAAFTACDSRLYIVQEALDAEGKWRPIESLPFTNCGNSFHRVFLKADEYWEFKARTYSGAIKTKIRFRLDPDGEDKQAAPIYSDEFDAQIAKAQFR